MSFVSTEFAVLFGVVLLLLLVLRSNQWKKVVVLGASCVFYAYWDWRFLGLLAVITLVDYYISHQIARTESPRRRRFLLTISLVVSLGALAVFKYFNFFVDNLNLLLAAFRMNLGAMEILLPVGISFYTFESVSYIVDVYRGHVKPAESLLDYGLFVSFFPRLVAGPIMRASNFLPQLEREIKLNVPNFLSGAQIFAQGLVKKLIVADRLSVGVDTIYKNPFLYSSSSVWVAVFSTLAQVYFDFSGYSDMAIGIGRIMGFELPQNFNLPLTSQSFAEFWQRWHISLSTWLRDYLYIPLGGNRVGKFRYYLNIMITMTLGGLWHGADWHFILWGAIHGAYLAVERLIYGSRPIKPQEGIVGWIKAGFTFVALCLATVFFRSPSMQIAGAIFGKLFFLAPGGIEWLYTPGIVFTAIIVLGGMVMRHIKFNIPTLDYSKPASLAFLMIVFVWIYVFAATEVNPFVYFQF
ncbi:MAG: MBOAT family O-acyltransferase [Chloroflexota bacterium]